MLSLAILLDAVEFVHADIVVRHLLTYDPSEEAGAKTKDWIVPVAVGIGSFVVASACLYFGCRRSASQNTNHQTTQEVQQQGNVAQPGGPVELQQGAPGNVIGMQSPQQVAQMLMMQQIQANQQQLQQQMMAQQAQYQAQHMNYPSQSQQLHGGGPPQAGVISAPMRQHDNPLMKDNQNSPRPPPNTNDMFNNSAPTPSTASRPSPAPNSLAQGTGSMQGMQPPDPLGLQSLTMMNNTTGLNVAPPLQQQKQLQQLQQLHSQRLSQLGQQLGQGFGAQGQQQQGRPQLTAMVLCANCRAKLFAPPPGTLFKCPHCTATQRMPTEITPSSAVLGVSCNVPECMCRNFASTKATNGHICECGHKKSIHKISRDEVNQAVAYPIYWDGDLMKSLRTQVSSDIKEQVQALMNDTWKDKATIDRSAGESVPRRFEVVQVLRNQNPQLWVGYWLKREVIRKEMGSEPHVPGNAVVVLDPKTQSFQPTLIERSTSSLDAGCNEVFLFHGTRPSAADRICEKAFKIELAGSNRGMLYGPGLYFAESSSKSDEYAQDDSDGLYQGLYATLLCRVVMGNWLYNDEVRPDEQNLANNCLRGQYHSVVGDREKCRGTFREYVVYDNDQAYPEFIVIYRRIYD